MNHRAPSCYFVWRETTTGRYAVDWPPTRFTNDEGQAFQQRVVLRRVWEIPVMLAPTGRCTGEGMFEKVLVAAEERCRAYSPSSFPP